MHRAQRRQRWKHVQIQTRKIGGDPLMVMHTSIRCAVNVATTPSSEQDFVGADDSPAAPGLRGRTPIDVRHRSFCLHARGHLFSGSGKPNALAKLP